MPSKEEEDDSQIPADKKTRRRKRKRKYYTTIWVHGDLQPTEQREQNPTDGAARGEAKLAWAIPSRDRGRQSQTCLSYAEISCKREQSQACLAMPSAADIQRS